MKTLIAAVGLLILSLSLYADTVSLNLLWESTTFRRANTDRAQAVAALHNRTIVGEVLGRPDNPETDVAVKGFNSTTGHLVWTDEFPALNIRVQTAHGVAIAVAEIDDQEDGTNLFLRAYQVHDGTILWTSQMHSGALQQILFRGGRIGLVGYTSQAPIFQGQLGGFILVLDALTGQPVWSKIVSQPPQIPIKDTVLWDLDNAGQNLVVLGTIGVSQRDLLVQSYRFANGHLRWEKTVPLTFGTTVGISNGVAYVTGLQSGGSAYLAGFSITDGSVVWQAPSGFAGGIRLAVSDTAIITADFHAVTIFNRLTKSLVGTFTIPIPPNLDDGVIRILPIGDNLLVLSQLNTVPSMTPIATIVRVIGPTGQLVFDERFDNIFLSDAVFLNSRLTIIGSSAAGALVRTYGVILP